MFGTPEFPALVRLARCKNARVLVAVVLHEDAGASSIAAKALGQLCAAPSPRALAVSSLVDALLHGGDHEKPQGARALQEMARRDKEAIGAMLSSEAIPGRPPPYHPSHHAPLTTHPSSDARLASPPPRSPRLAPPLGLRPLPPQRRRRPQIPCQTRPERGEGDGERGGGPRPRRPPPGATRRRPALSPARPSHSSHVPPFPFRRRVSRSPRARGRCCVRSAVTCRKCGSRGSLSRVWPRTRDAI